MGVSPPGVGMCDLAATCFMWHEYRPWMRCRLNLVLISLAVYVRRVRWRASRCRPRRTGRRCSRELLAHRAVPSVGLRPGHVLVGLLLLRRQSAGPNRDTPPGPVTPVSRETKTPLIRTLRPYGELTSDDRRCVVRRYRRMLLPQVNLGLGTAICSPRNSALRRSRVVKGTGSFRCTTTGFVSGGMVA